MLEWVVVHDDTEPGTEETDSRVANLKLVMEVCERMHHTTTGKEAVHTRSYEQIKTRACPRKAQAGS
jgi:hypothetical protein